MIYFTSDTHFYHKNVVDYCNRPYRTADGHPDIKAMNEDLINRWNAVVGPEDTVFHLGDFAFGGPGKCVAIRQALNGHIFLIKGNHDSSPSKWLKPLDKWAHSLQIGELFLGHVPPGKSDFRDIPTQPYAPETKVFLCGHVHEKWAEKEHEGMRVVNVGVDVRGLVPVTLEELGLDSSLVKGYALS